MKSPVFCLLALTAATALADVKMPALFSDHMVLQQAVNAPVWGYAAPGEEVKVALAGQTKTATAAPDGKWMVKLDPQKPGEPQTLTIQGKNTVTIKDVLIGEVWLGSGQSNMGMMVQSAQDFEKEKAAANLPLIRVFTEGSGPSETPQTIGKGQWVICTPETVGRFSATLFFFGRELQKTIGGPFGLINSSVGGTPIESWIDAATQEKTPELKAFFEMQRQEAAAFDPVAAKARFEKQFAAWQIAAEKAKAAGQTPPVAPRDPVATRQKKGAVGQLFNAKIAPLIPYALRGIIWYQGEANCAPAKAPYYEHQLPLLVTDWRARWGQPELPFAWAQLPNIGEGRNAWPLVREAMRKTLRLKNTGMGINIDLGEERNVHPKNKQEVGRRLSLWALGTVYGKPVPATSGPLPAGHQTRGNEIVLKFQHTNGGLQAKGDADLRGFTIAGPEGKFVKAQAKIQGETIVVSSPEVPNPTAARYAWSNWPDANLTNGANLPATPFRTDTGTP